MSSTNSENPAGRPESPDANSRQTLAAGRTAASISHGIGNVIWVGLVVYLTYFFTTVFSRTKAPAPVPNEAVSVAAKKVEVLEARQRTLLNSFSRGNGGTEPARIPIDRAMDLIVEEYASGPATSAAPPIAQRAAPAPGAIASVTKPESPVGIKPIPGVAAHTPATVATAVTAPPPPARAGMPPAQLYRAICQACHDVDGRGGLVRKAMPAIPDFTDPKWQGTRTDAELQHSMLEGKGQLMLPMKDKFALAQTEVQEMVAFVRAFRPGGAAATTLAQASTAPPHPAEAALAVPPVVVSPSVVATGPPVQVTTPVPTALSTPAAMATPIAPTQPLSSTATTPTALPSSVNAPARAAAPSPEKAARSQAATAFYQVNCIACHGLDGRGSVIRIAMPAIPDFTLRQWQLGHEDAQLAVSVLEGKGALMPPWRGRMSLRMSQDLIAFVRTFGPPDLVRERGPATDFENRFQTLHSRWEELHRQALGLSPPR